MVIINNIGDSLAPTSPPCSLASYLRGFPLMSSQRGGAIKPVVTFTPNWRNVLQDDSVTLTFDVPSTVPEEPRTYHWYKDNQPIPGDQQKLRIIRSSVVEDRGDYQCQTIGGDISDPVFLNVTYHDLILQRPPSALYEGDPLTLRCHHWRFYDKINTTFYKDDQEIKSSKSDSTFHIPNIMMKFFSPPEIKVTPSRVIGGDNMTMRCDTRLDPLIGGTELHFAFYRDGRTVRGYNVSDTYRVWSAQLENSGNYTCEGRTASQTVRKLSDGLYIQIMQIHALKVGKSGGAIKPVVTFTPNWGNILYYDDVTLTCDVPSTVPEEPRTYQWYKDKRPIPGDQQRLRIIRYSVEEDRGDYQCQTIGGDISDPVFLDVTRSYVILQRPPSVIYEGDPLTLRCHHVKDFNSTNTKFYKDDQEIKSSESDSTFHIPNIMINQSGLYKCTKQIYSNDSSKVHENSDVSFISVKDNDLPVAVIAAAVIGSLVVIVVSAVLIWKCKTRKRFSHQDPHQAIPTILLNNKPPENNTDPDLQDVCYTYLDISQLSKGKRIKHEDLTVTYATVNNVNI
ncbi:Fc receptor-like protein 5 [Aquarana catesbeiana]|uniref:Fc receptor-like protein 5 n=1 Tax=Aquarana catesbeiana TaxID=8400 RepID=UPI003CC9743A